MEVKTPLNKFLAWVGVTTLILSALVLAFPFLGRWLVSVLAFSAFLMAVAEVLKHRGVLAEAVADANAYAERKLAGRTDPTPPAASAEVPQEPPVPFVVAEKPDTRKPESTAVEAPEPRLVSATREEKHAQAIQLLALLQEKGRLVDFLMDDVTAASNDQVGAAARVVHQGCRQVLTDYVKVEPVNSASEGSKVSLKSGFPIGEYRVSGSWDGKGDLTGKLLHHGWKVAEMKLPELRLRSDGEWPPLAPAQVEAIKD